MKNIYIYTILLDIRIRKERKGERRDASTICEREFMEGEDYWYMNVMRWKIQDEME